MTWKDVSNAIVKSDIITGSIKAYQNDLFAVIIMEITPSSIPSNQALICSGLPLANATIYHSVGTANGKTYTVLISTGNMQFNYPQNTELSRIDATIVYPIL